MKLITLLFLDKFLYFLFFFFSFVSTSSPPPPPSPPPINLPSSPARESHTNTPLQQTIPKTRPKTESKKRKTNVFSFPPFLLYFLFFFSFVSTSPPSPPLPPPRPINPFIIPIKGSTYKYTPATGNTKNKTQNQFVTKLVNCAAIVSPNRSTYVEADIRSTAAETSP